jgi:hypothetical protein
VPNALQQQHQAPAHDLAVNQLTPRRLPTARSLASDLAPAHQQQTYSLGMQEGSGHHQHHDHTVCHVWDNSSPDGQQHLLPTLCGSLLPRPSNASPTHKSKLPAPTVHPHTLQALLMASYAIQRKGCQLTTPPLKLQQSSAQPAVPGPPGPPTRPVGWFGWPAPPWRRGRRVPEVHREHPAAVATAAVAAGERCSLRSVV